jgi:hypothetical protein
MIPSCRNWLAEARGMLRHSPHPQKKPDRFPLHQNQYWQAAP